MPLPLLFLFFFAAKSSLAVERKEERKNNQQEGYLFERSCCVLGGDSSCVHTEDVPPPGVDYGERELWAAHKFYGLQRLRRHPGFATVLFSESVYAGAFEVQQLNILV